MCVHLEAHANRFWAIRYTLADLIQAGLIFWRAPWTVKYAPLPNELGKIVGRTEVSWSPDVTPMHTLNGWASKIRANRQLRRRILHKNPFHALYTYRRAPERFLSPHCDVRWMYVLIAGRIATPITALLLLKT